MSQFVVGQTYPLRNGQGVARILANDFKGTDPGALLVVAVKYFGSEKEVLTTRLADGRFYPNRDIGEDIINAPYVQKSRYFTVHSDLFSYEYADLTEARERCVPGALAIIAIRHMSDGKIVAEVHDV